MNKLNPYEPMSSPITSNRSPALRYFWLIAVVTFGYAIGWWLLPIPDPADPSGSRSGAFVFSFVALVGFYCFHYLYRPSARTCSKESQDSSE